MVDIKFFVETDVFIHEEELTLKFLTIVCCDQWIKTRKRYSTAWLMDRPTAHLRTNYIKPPNVGAHMY